jgi:hypothetical protein
VGPARKRRIRRITQLVSSVTGNDQVTLRTIDAGELAGP